MCPRLRVPRWRDQRFDAPHSESLCKVEISLVPVLGCYGPMPKFGCSAHGGRARGRGSAVGPGAIRRSAHVTNARAETQARRRRGASGDGRPRPNRNRTGRQERGGVRRRRGPQAQPTALHTDTSVLRVSHHAPSRESRGHGRSTLRSVVLITTKPDRGADVPQMYRVRRHRRIEAPTPVAMHTCQDKQPRTMSSIATHAPWLGLSWDVVERTSSTLCCVYCSQKHTVKRPYDGCLVLRAALNLLDGLCRGLQCLKSRTLR